MTVRFIHTSNKRCAQTHKFNNGTVQKRQCQNVRMKKYPFECRLLPRWAHKLYLMGRLL